MHTEGRVRVNALDWITLALVIVGALVWGLVGLGGLAGTNWNVISMLFASVPIVENGIYVLVGLAGLYELYFAYQLYSGTERSERRQRTT